MAFDLKGFLFSLIHPAAPSGSVNLPFQVEENGPNVSVSVSAPIATSSVVGLAKPDNSTINVAGDGTLSANISGLGSALGIPASTPVPRGTTGTANTSSTYAPLPVSFPSGSAAGDDAFIFVGSLVSSFQPNTPSGWTALATLSVSFAWQVTIFRKTLSSADISAGSVSVAFTAVASPGNAFKAQAACISFTGAIGGIRNFAQAEISQGTSTTQTISTNSSPIVGDFAMYFGSNSLDFGTISEAISRGTTQQSANLAGGDWTGLLKTETLTASGTVSATFTTGSGSSNYGAYGGVLVVYGTGTGTVTLGSGSVTSVAMTVPSRQSVSGSPITNSGTLAVADNNQNANLVFAGPASGAAAAPTFRALAPADVPVMVASGSSHAAGLAPDPGSTAGTTKFLREDATWAVPSGGGGGGGITYPYGNVYAVGSGSGMYSTIAAAITAINAGTAPTSTTQAVIFVYPGYYTSTTAMVVPQWVSIKGVCENFPVMLVNNSTDVFQASGFNQFSGLTFIQGTTSSTYAINVGNNTDVNVLNCAMYKPASGTAEQGLVGASGSSWARVSIRGCIVNSAATGSYIVVLNNTSSAARFNDCWIEECFFDSYSLTTFGGGINCVNVQDVRIERSTIRGSVTYNTSIRCTKVTGMTGTPQVEVRHCYCAGGVPLFCDTGTIINVLNTDAAGSIFSGTANQHNSYTSTTYNALGNI